MLDRSPVSGSTVTVSTPVSTEVRFSTAEIKKRIDRMFTEPEPVPMRPEA
ncbi:hypothetical protein OED52_16295 [Rhodococcus sp. Z13]|uniref:Uncharacterized protein n=1 Tax=Rhodococcus sacchari TaxID=2962047 RepID=A0ACD4DE32_9NOCA|nr:hypothetical protein [Rhodococcus sp. Z13]UYP18205.1 hypothetical protein OED52_16295 [Rhodococcus sp. Z13]